MTITRLRQAGAEHGGASVLAEKAEWDYVSGGTNSWIPTTGNKRTGNYSYYVNANYGRYGGWGIPATRQIRMGFSMNNSYTDWGSRTYGNVLRLAASDDATILAVGWNTTAEKTAGQINIYFNSSWQGASSGSVIGIQRWLNFALDVKIDSSAGWAKFYIDGVEVLSYTSTNTGDVDIEKIYVGPSGSEWSGGTVGVYWDDIYADDTTGESVPTEAPPALRFYWVKPDGNGNYSQWVGSDADSTDNYLLVDEVPTAEADYVESATADEYDSYTMTTFTLGEGQTINAVIPWALAKRFGNSEQIALGTRLSSTDLDGSDQVVPTDWKAYMERQTTKPGGGSWAQADLDAFEVLLKARGTY